MKKKLKKKKMENSVGLNNRGSIDWMLLLGFFLVFLSSLTVVFFAGKVAGQENNDQNTFKKYHLPDARKKVVPHIGEGDKKEDDKPVVNLIGECPPVSDDYECPMSVQETERNAFISPDRETESARIIHFEK